MKMTLQRLPVLMLLSLLALLQIESLQADLLGYHYDRPSGPSAPASSYTGHQFKPLPTIQPLPPVPALPPLPTARVPLPRSRPTVASIVSQYLPPAVASPIASISFHGSTAAQLNKPVYGAPPPPQAVSFLQPTAPTATFFQPTAPPAPYVRSAAPAGPLRIPFGKQALIAPGESYVANGRQLKQYAVIEIIDNDIDETPAPFLSSNFFDRYRAQSNGVQLDSRANSLLLEQQSLGIQSRSQQPSQGQADAIALGSGGLGYIRLPNGNVYLGSGSLGYISGQQRVASVLDARTRSDSIPDALHFGHGPLGGQSGNLLRFK
ncbi:uncharacterized protein [Drosophila tropicalis]|uniref:uncharacterized protein n=1 Tax=Drosophila tropicalis TaxID=46794 RepID=UPI0035ABEE84